MVTTRRLPAGRDRHSAFVWMVQVSLHQIVHVVSMRHGLMPAVGAHGRDQDLAAELRAAGRRAIVVVCDVTRDGALEQTVAEALRAFGRLDVAVANAGFGVVGPMERLALDDSRRQFETNVFGVLRTAAASASGAPGEPRDAP